jgi:hypothetical protein
VNTRNRSRYPKARDKWSLLWFIPSNVLNMREETTNVKGQVIKKGGRVGFETFNQLSCKDCRTVFHKTLSFAFHCSEENHGHLVNPFSTRSNVHIRTGLTKKLKVQNEEELENILDLGPRQVKRSLPESTAAAKRLKKYSLVVRTVPEDIISDIENMIIEDSVIIETDDSEADIEVTSNGANKPFTLPAALWSPPILEERRSWRIGGTPSRGCAKATTPCP